ncbi:hypothetical protein [Variovorax boronicumulans]|uniref:hypothetical protein n=1 Tax=Variovorax boronicumulans TaxID=436515 RepID=UPI0027D831C4|nr:hypothetical protein [Variovorax boronicumulans]
MTTAAIHRPAAARSPAAKRRAAQYPSAKDSDRVTQNADGEWMLDGEIVRCSLGGHEGKARHLLFVKQLQEADAAGRERMLKEWGA